MGLHLFPLCKVILKIITKIIVINILKSDCDPNIFNHTFIYLVLKVKSSTSQRVFTHFFTLRKDNLKIIIKIITDR